MTALSESRVRATTLRVLAAGEKLRRLPQERIADALRNACQLLGEDGPLLTDRAREAIAESSGLSLAMVDWALTHEVHRNARGDAFANLCCTMPVPLAEPCKQQPMRLCAVILAGNVFTSIVRAVTFPLLARTPVVVKPSSSDDTFAHLFESALRAADEVVGEAFGVASFKGGESTEESALFTLADVVSAYGSDATLAAIREKLPASTTFIAHGSGLGAGYVSTSALQTRDAAIEAARRVALDVAAYDQRGCLSPHVVWVQTGGLISPAAFAEHLFRDGLEPLANGLPRGPLSTPAGSAQLQWRGVAAAVGRLFEGDGYAVSYEGRGPFRLSPGFRNVLILECNGPEDLAQQLAPLGVHLKALGVAGNDGESHRVAERLPTPLAPRVTSAGSMQTPPLGAVWDGIDPWTGVLRWVAQPITRR